MFFSNIFDTVDSRDIYVGLQFDGSDLFPPLKIGNTLAHFISLGNCPVCMFLSMRFAIIGLRLFIASLKISGPVAFDGSNTFIYEYPAQVSLMEK